MVKKVIKVEFDMLQMNFLLSCVPKLADNPLKEWLPNQAWNSVQRLADLDEFRKIPESMEKEMPGRFKDWFNEIAPEEVKLPGDWRKLETQPFQKLCVIRALRPDRMTNSLTAFIKNSLPNGEAFVNMDSSASFKEILESAFEDATQESQLNIPIFFILSPGADPVKDVETMGKIRGFGGDKNNYFNISLGQGMDKYAEAKLEAGVRDGYWIMLQNIHLMPSWLPTLDKKLEQYSKEGGSSSNFRLYLSGDPSDGIPIGILERCIKLTNEPPAGLKPNMKRGWTFFPREEIEEKDPRVKCVLFGMCYFHACLLERRKFGPKGWNMFYPFSIGDLRDSYYVLCKNIENNASGRLPWADLKYIFGEIMYGGHIVDDWDRKLCMAYLDGVMQNDLTMDDFELFSFVEGKGISLKTPPQGTPWEVYLQHMDSEITVESAMAYGLHPNAEIGLGTQQCNYMFEMLFELMPKDSSASAGEGDKVKSDEMYISKVIGDWNIKEKMFNLLDIKDRIAEKGPYQNAFLQECEYMNFLLEEINRSLVELEQGIRGVLTISETMENLQNSLNMERIPPSWEKLAYPAKRSLATWFENLLKRIEQLSAWKDDPANIPKCTRLSFLFNPQSFLTAIKQVSKLGELNKLIIVTEFTKKCVEEVDSTPKIGAYTCGF